MVRRSIDRVPAEAIDGAAFNRVAGMARGVPVAGANDHSRTSACKHVKIDPGQAAMRLQRRIFEARRLFARARMGGVIVSGCTQEHRERDGD